MTSINIKDQQVRVTIESYAKKKKKKTKTPIKHKKNKHTKKKKKKKKKLHDYPFSCIHSHTSSYYLDLFYKNNIHYSLSSEAHQNSP
jgi:hypothetical protein